MKFFTWHMPPFLSIMGVLYLLVAAPILLSILRAGYWRGVWTQLLRLTGVYWRWISLTIVFAVASIIWLDIPVTLAVKRLDVLTQSYTFWDFICSCAEGGFVAGVLFTLHLLAKQFKQHRLAEVACISLMGSIYGGLANGVLKFIFNRQRPAIGLDQWHFFAFFTSDAHHVSDLLYAYNSMPSGHTITTVAALVPFYASYRQPWLRCLLICWGLMVAFARVYTINHWLSDVTIATMLGLLIGVAIYQVNCHRLAAVDH